MWSLLGARGVDALAWESFGKVWLTDVVKELKLTDAPRHRRPSSACCRIWPRSISRRDVLFTWNGTTSGVRVPGRRLDPRRSRRPDAGRRDVRRVRPADRLHQGRRADLLVPEGAGRRGRARRAHPVAARRRALETHKPAWPMPKLFRMTKGGKFDKAIFEGETINTPSMLCVEDYLDALAWAESVGGHKGLIARADANAKVLHDWIDRTRVDRQPRASIAPRGRTRVCLEDRRSRRRGARRRGKRSSPRRWESPREGRRGLRHRLLPRRAGGPAHLVRLHRRNLRRRGPRPWLEWAFASQSLAKAA